MSDPASTAAIFLSYARDDAVAARRIAEALRAGGLEVWFDENELRGGDAWDQKIRRQIDACTLFVPIISRQTEVRAKGYFRLEWKLAVDQTHMLAEGVPFIAPVVIDDTGENGARVPPEFLRVQWTRLPRALPTPQLVEQMRRLLERTPAAAITAAPMPMRSAPLFEVPPASPPVAKSRFPLALGAALAVGALALVAYVALRPGAKTPGPGAARAAGETKPAGALEKSVAVLPFASFGSDKENAAFADGMHDDVITNLQKIRDLKIISRTSVLAYRDNAARNLAKIAEELGVATVVEGSVQRAGNKIKVNAKLIVARTEASLWADTLEGDASDAFALQAKLATQIAAALKTTLTANERSLIERRPTESHEAYEFYSRARLLWQATTPGSVRAEYEPIVSFYEQAVAKDPAFALAFAHLSTVHGMMYWFAHVDGSPERRAQAESALASARRLAPDAPETHFAQGEFAYRCNNDWKGALTEFAIAEPGMPKDSQLQEVIGLTYRRLGRLTEAVARLERAVALNPRELAAVISLVQTVGALRRYEEMRTLAQRHLAVTPGDRTLRELLASAQFGLDGDFAAYVRARAAIGAAPRDTMGLQFAYVSAILARDLPAAKRILEDPRLSLGGGGNIGTVSAFMTAGAGFRSSSVPLNRAFVAFLLGEQEAVVKFADQAIEEYKRDVPGQRRAGAALIGIATAEALAGRAAEAVRDGRLALQEVHAQDEYSAFALELSFATIQLILGQRDAALASLREVMSRPGTNPHAVRHDLLWSRLKDDPRFEEILKSAKVF